MSNMFGVGPFITIPLIIASMGGPTSLSISPGAFRFFHRFRGLDFLRRHWSDILRPFRMCLYPIPSVIAFLGWIYIFLTSGWIYTGFGLCTLVLASSFTSSQRAVFAMPNHWRNRPGISAGV
jgi:hypothetical protein